VEKPKEAVHSEEEQRKAQHEMFRIYNIFFRIPTKSLESVTFHGRILADYSGDAKKRAT